jgi:Domain of unknown function (DUF932)
MTEASAAVLSAHTNTNLVTREQLRALPTVAGTSTFKPVAHIELVETLENQLNERGIQIARDASGLLKEQYSLSENGLKLFGTLDLTLNGVEGMCASLGLRQALDRSMSIQMIAGMRVFVCDNMAFSGDTILLNRKHTSGLNLIDEIVSALNDYERHYRTLKTEIASLGSMFLDDARAEGIIYDIFVKREVMPVRFLPYVHEVYFKEFVINPEPKFSTFSDRNAWSLLNAFTEVAKQMPLTTRMVATQKVGKVFGKLVG